MKRLPLLFTVLIIGALALAACSGGEDTTYQGTPGVGTTTYPTEAVVGEPGTDLTGTPAVEDGFGTEVAETPSVGETTEAVEETPTDESTEAAVVSTPTVETGENGGVGIPNTGVESQYVLLSNVLKMRVEDQSGEQLGNVQGVVINRAAGSVDTSSEAAPSDATEAPTDTAVQETPTADVSGSNTGTDTGAAALGDSPRVAFVLVNVTGAAASSSNNSSNSNSSNAASSTAASGNQVLVPWEAFDVSGVSSGLTVDNNSGTDTTVQETPAATEAATEAAGTDVTGMDNGEGALVLSVDASVLTSAPAFDESAFNGTVGSDVASYWSGQVPGIPMTGDAAAREGDAVLVRGQIGSLSLNGSDGKTMGQVQDFVIDAETGEIVYAVLGGGSTFGGNLYVVPIAQLNWMDSQGQGASLGTFETDLSQDAFSAAPSFSSVNELQGSDWSSEVDAYWNNQ